MPLRTNPTSLKLRRIKFYRVDVPPIAQQRPRFIKNHFWDSQSQDKVSFGLVLLRQHENEKPFTMPVQFRICFYMPIPKSKSKVQPDTYCTGKKDIDNMAKFIFDSCVDANILSDDNIVVALDCRKIYSTQPRTEFQIIELDSGDMVDFFAIGG